MRILFTLDSHDHYGPFYSMESAHIFADARGFTSYTLLAQVPEGTRIHEPNYEGTNYARATLLPLQHVRVTISTLDGEVLNQMTVESHRRDTAILGSHIEEHISAAFEVKEV